MNYALAKQFLPGTIKARRIWSGPLRGRRIATSWKVYPRSILGVAERPLLSWFERHVRSGQTWLDIGAHHGYTSIALSQLVGAHGRVFAFEALPRTAGALAETKRANRFSQLVVVPIGLGTPRELERIETCPTASGMATYRDRAEGLTESIFIQALDRLWPGVCGSDGAIHGAKIDVQGYEIDVLIGMLELLKSQQPLLALETHVGVDRQRLLEVLAEANYDCRPIPVDLPADMEVASQQAAHVPWTMLDNVTYAFRPSVTATWDRTHKAA